MERLNGYMIANSFGGVSYDMEALMVDVVTLFKAGGFDQSAMHEAVDDIWPQVEVEVTQLPMDS